MHPRGSHHQTRAPFHFSVTVLVFSQVEQQLSGWKSSIMTTSDPTELDCRQVYQSAIAFCQFWADAAVGHLPVVMRSWCVLCLLHSYPTAEHCVSSPQPHTFLCASTGEYGQPIKRHLSVRGVLPVRPPAETGWAPSDLLCPVQSGQVEVETVTSLLQQTHLFNTTKL